MANWFKVSDSHRVNLDHAVRTVAESYVQSGVKYRAVTYFSNDYMLIHAQNLTTLQEAIDLIPGIMDSFNS